MTAEQISRMLRGRRYAKGKYMARCPAHGEKTGSLSITDMGGGNVRLHCFAGCPQKAVLGAIGLTWRDLKPEGKIDPVIMRQIVVAEAKRKAQKEERTRLLWWARKRIEFWHRKSQVLGRSLMKWPEQDKLAREFHYALDMERRCQTIWESL